MIVKMEPRVYEEKYYSEEKDLALLGAPEGGTVLLWHDPAFEMMDDGFKRGTFRSYTAFFGGENLRLMNLTIRNDAGDGRIKGQTVAAYIDCTHALAENCTFDSYQDTLFVAPLPDEERERRGFMGPREYAPRRRTAQVFRHCTIIGDVDFIFGGADAVFDDCEIICRDREHAPGVPAEQEASGERFINGYITAPCGHRDGLGLIFRNCRIRGEEGMRPGTFFLGRPWRPEGKTAFLNCTYGAHIAPEGFSGWRGVREDEPDAFLAEYRPVYEDGTPVDTGERNSWVKNLTEKEAAALSAAADELVERVEAALAGAGI